MTNRLSVWMVISIFLFLATLLNPLPGAGLEVSSRDKFVPLGWGCLAQLAPTCGRMPQGAFQSPQKQLKKFSKVPQRGYG
jgi:hypothetical protein